MGNKVLFVVGVPICLTDFLDSQQRFSFVVFLAAMFLFWDMVCEDAADELVDIRKAGILAIGLCLSSRYTVAAYICQAGLVFAALRMCWMLTLRHHRQTGEESTERNTIRIPFLPCLAAALAILIFLMLTRVKGDGGIEFYSTIWIITYISDSMLLPDLPMVFFGIGYLAIEYFHWHFYRRKNDMIAGIGMGDIYVLPLFAGFLGIPFFTVVFTTSLICGAIAGGIKKYFIRRDQVHVTGSNVQSKREV